MLFMKCHLLSVPRRRTKLVDKIILQSPLLFITVRLPQQVWEWEYMHSVPVGQGAMYSLSRLRQLEFTLTGDTVFQY
jgi:hypothetical protein